MSYFLPYPEAMPNSRLLDLNHVDGDGVSLRRYRYTLDGRGNRVQMQEVEPGSSGSETIAADDDRIQYLKGIWAIDGAYEASDDFSARFRLNFWGDQAIITFGHDDDGGIVDIYADQNYWGSIDTYAASSGDEAVTINFYKDTFHRLEVRNTTNLHPDSTGRKLRLKQIQVSTELALQTIQYTYDALARLQAAGYYEGDDLSATPTRQYAYHYDPAGNRTQQVVTVSGSPTTTNYTYNTANQLTGDGVKTYSYDANGNLTGDGTNTYDWDRANRLLSYQGSDYAYNGLGQRVSQEVSSVVTEYLLDVQPGLWKVIAATASGNTDRFIHDPMGVAQHEDNSGNWHWMAKDGLGTVRGIYDDTLTEVYAADRDPYGDLIASTGSNPTPFEYTGEPEDQNGLLHLRARYYDPSLAVFNSLDPVETPNRYAYVGGDPVNNVDPSGNRPACSSGGSGNQQGSTDCFMDENGRYYSSDCCPGIVQFFTDNIACPCDPSRCQSVTPQPTPPTSTPPTPTVVPTQAPFVTPTFAPPVATPVPPTFTPASPVAPASPATPNCGSIFGCDASDNAIPSIAIRGSLQGHVAIDLLPRTAFRPGETIPNPDWDITSPTDQYKTVYTPAGGQVIATQDSCRGPGNVVDIKIRTNLSSTVAGSTLCFEFKHIVPFVGNATPPLSDWDPIGMVNNWANDQYTGAANCLTADAGNTSHLHFAVFPCDANGFKSGPDLDPHPWVPHLETLD